MTEPDQDNSLKPDTVDALARLVGFPGFDPDTLARIAVGASNAVAAVRASVEVSLFDAEPGAYLAELDRLAGSAP